MKLFKYDGVADKTLKLSLTGNQTTTTTTSDPPSRSSNTQSSSSGSRTIWGQYDDGDDIDGSSTISGNLTIKAAVPKQYEYDPDFDYGDDDDGEDEFEEEGGGNITAEGDIKCSNLFVNVNNTETNIVSYVKLRDTSINNNTNKLTNHETRITALENRPVCDCSARIGAVEEDVEKIKEDISTGLLSGDLSDIQK